MSIKSALLVFAFSFPITAQCQGILEPLDQDEAGIWREVDKHEQFLRTSDKSLDDPILNSYLQQLTCQIAPDHCEHIRVYVVRSPGFNAFMFPNGALFVQTGLLLRMDDDAEIAAVLGHEIGHYTHEHTINRIRATRRTASAFAFAGAIVGAAGAVGQGTASTYEGAANAAAMTDSAFAMINLAGIYASFQLIEYGRDQETEADEIGFDRLSSAGMDPRGPSRVWAKVIREHLAGGEYAGFSLFSTHPSPASRLANLSEMAATMPDGTADSATLLSLIDPYREAWLNDESVVQHPRQFEYIAEQQINKGVDAGLGYYLLGKSWERRSDNERRNSLIEEARNEAVRAFSNGADSVSGLPAEGYREWAKLEVELGNPARAKELFLTYLELAPDAWDARFVEREISRL